MFKKLLSAAAVASMATAPVLAAPIGPASNLSLARASTSGKHSSQIAPPLIAVFLVIVIAGSAVALSNDDSPDSP